MCVRSSKPRFGSGTKFEGQGGNLVKIPLSLLPSLNQLVTTLRNNSQFRGMPTSAWTTYLPLFTTKMMSFFLLGVGRTLLFQFADDDQDSLLLII